DYIREYIKKKTNGKWPKDWTRKYLLGLRSPGTLGQPSSIYLPKKHNTLSAALTLVHEATHVVQTLRGEAGEIQAYTRETKFLIQLIKVSPGIDKFAPKKILSFLSKNSDGTYKVNEKAI